MIASVLSGIPFPVWLAIGCVVVLLLNYYVKQAVARAKGAVPAPRDVRMAGKEKDWNKLNEHHTPKIHGKREDMATDPRARLLAPSMVYALCNGDPVNEWKAHLDRLTDLKNKMNALDLESVHFESANGTDLTVGIADKATWESAASVSEKGVVFLPNIPTEEVFTAPHKDKVDGIVYGTKPYVFNGQLIKGFHVTFKDGRVVEHGAEEGAELLGQLLDTDEGARSIGEVALVPASSPINRSGALFYSTLFDENAACHIAFGASYPGTTENGTRLSKDELLARGMNQSTIHEDVMVGAEDSHITGKCRDGRTVELFRDGVWVL